MKLHAEWARAPWPSSVLRVLDAAGLELACCTWLIAYAVMMSLVVRGAVTAIPYGVYVEAGAHWLARQPLYDRSNIDGFQYLPTSAWIFSAFTRMGTPLGACAWRALGGALYATGLWRMCKRTFPGNARAAFAITTTACMGSVANNFGNGQANLWLAALWLHVAADLAARRWNRVALVLALGLALKPLMIVLLLMAAASYRALRWRVPLATLLVFAAPFAFVDAHWLAQQYADCVFKLSVCAKPDRLFEDVRSLLVRCGWPITHDSYFVLRCAAALGACAVALLARARLREPRASFVIAATAATYLVLFNPRTLSTSYAIAVAWAALLMLHSLINGRTRTAVAACAVVICWSLSSNWAVPLRNWSKPLAGLVFAGQLLATIQRQRHERFGGGSSPRRNAPAVRAM